MLLLAGCAGDQIQFEGKVFEWAGLSDMGKARKEPKVEARAPLVVPPSPNLPEPGAQAATARPENWPEDEREVRARELAAAKEKLEDYRRHGNWNGRGGIDEFEKVVNPMRRRPGMLSKKSGGFEIDSSRGEASVDDVENITNNVDMEKLKAERRAQAEKDAKDPDNSWVSKPGDERAHKQIGPDDVENMRGPW